MSRPLPSHSRISRHTSAVRPAFYCGLQEIRRNVFISVVV